MVHPGTSGRVVVLGGTGYLGRHVCRAFAALGHEVVTVSRRADQGRAAATRTLLLDLSVVSPEDCAAALAAERPAVVVNAAGGVWSVSPEQMEASNVTLVRRLVAALETMPSRPRLVHLGSVHEYAPVSPGVPIDEATPLGPVSLYGRTKLIGTDTVLAAVEGRGLNAVVLRVANVSGPGAPRGSLLGRTADQLADAARHDRPAILQLSPLRAERDFVDVRDVAAAVTAAAFAPVAGRVVNIGRGEAVSVRHLVDLLIAASGLPAVVVEAPERDVAVRDGGVEWQRVDISAAGKLLDWAPRIGLPDSLRALWESVAP